MQQQNIVDKYCKTNIEQVFRNLNWLFVCHLCNVVYFDHSTLKSPLNDMFYKKINTDLYFVAAAASKIPLNTK